MTARPKLKALAQRISEKIAGHPDVEASLANFPAPIRECWPWRGKGAKLIYFQGTTKPVVRTLIEIGCREPLLDCWIPVRQASCSNNACVNPCHFALKPYNQNRYGEQGPIPARLMKINTCEIEDIRALLDEWGCATRLEFLERCAECHFEFSEAALDEAFSPSEG